MKTFDPTKPVQTRDGRRARILCTDGRGSHPIVALVYDSLHVDGEHLVRHDRYGRVFAMDGIQSDSDLINTPRQREGWVNVFPAFQPRAYAAGTSSVYHTKEAADNSDGAINRIACCRIEWEE